MLRAIDELVLRVSAAYGSDSVCNPGSNIGRLLRMKDAIARGVQGYRGPTMQDMCLTENK